MSTTAPLQGDQENIPHLLAIQLVQLCHQFFGASSQDDWEELRRDLTTALERGPPHQQVVGELLHNLLDEIDERLMIQHAVACWADDMEMHATITAIEPSQWRVPVTVDAVDHQQIIVYAQKTWDLHEEDVSILLNPGGHLTEPLRY